MTAPQQHQANPKGVSFTVVEVRENPRILGDSPSVSSGPPISIRWKYDEKATLSVPVEEWERIRDGDRRTKQEIRVPEDIRRAWLIDAGYSGSEMQRVINDIAKDKKHRRSSLDKSDLQDKAEAFAEIRAGGFLAHGVQLLLAQHRFDALDLAVGGHPHADPVRFALAGRADFIDQRNGADLVGAA